jgi:hypothetical protein
VARICSATTSWHVARDELDQGHGDDDRVEGSRAAGAKPYQAPRKRGRSQHGRADAPQRVLGLAVTRAGLPVRHGVWPGHTVDVSTVAPGTDAVRGWHLSRCVWVGDPGLVSQDPLTQLRQSGGPDIVCLPMRRGAAVTHAVLQRPGRFQQGAEPWRGTAVVVGEGERRRR